MPIDDDIVTRAVDSVRQDVVEGFAAALSPRDHGFQIDLDGSPAVGAVTTSESMVTVPWAYACVHTGPFLGVPPTYVDVELRGATVVRVEGVQAEWSYHRYIDFLGALHQLGVSTSVRPVLTPDQYANWDAHRPS